MSERLTEHSSETHLQHPSDFVGLKLLTAAHMLLLESQAVLHHVLCEHVITTQGCCGGIFDHTVKTETVLIKSTLDQGAQPATS